MRGLTAIAITGLMLMYACAPDGAAPGVRGLCAAATGEPLCQETPIESPEDACTKLLECGSIPVANSEDNPNCFDYARCLRHFERLDDHRYDVSLGCVEISTCDQLRFPGGPDCPNPNDPQMPPCLEYGDQ